MESKYFLEFATISINVVSGIFCVTNFAVVSTVSISLNLFHKKLWKASIFWNEWHIQLIPENTSFP